MYPFINNNLYICGGGLGSVERLRVSIFFSEGLECERCSSRALTLTLGKVKVSLVSDFAGSSRSWRKTAFSKGLVDAWRSFGIALKVQCR